MLLIALLTLGSALSAAAAALQAEADDPSPASGHASVIAQGVADVPDGEVVWRVTSAEAEEATDTPADGTTADALGFVLADEDALVLNNLDTGAQVRLAAGEADFTPAGAVLQPIALGDEPVPYHRIDLVESPLAAEDDPTFAGEAFTAPEGNRDIDLVRDVLEQDEEVEVQYGSEDVPAVLFVTDGTVEIVPADDPEGEPSTLSAGEATEVTDEVVVRATDEDGEDEEAGATFVAAVVGPEVPPIPVEEETPVPTEPPALASLTVQALACPVAYEGDAFAEDCTEPLADVSFVLLIPATEFSVEGTTGPQGIVIFEELGENTYALTGGVPAEFAVQTVACVDEDGVVPTEPTQSEIPGGVFTIEAGDEMTCSWYVIPEDLQGETPTPEADADGDGLTDAQEAEFGTDPTEFDTDVDRLSDGFEAIEFGTDPLRADTDEDGLGDGDELETYMTDPLADDSDDDGVDDATEVDAGTDPNDPDSN